MITSTRTQTSTRISHITWTFPRSKGGGVWTVEAHDENSPLECSCPSAAYGPTRNCKHVRSVIEGNGPKPVVRLTVRPARRLTHVPVSDETRDAIAALDS